MLQLLRVGLGSRFEYDERAGHLSFDLIVHSDDGALGDRGVASNGGFKGPGGETVAGDVDHVVGAAHDVEITVFIDVPAITGGVEAGEGGQIGRDVALVVTPQSRERTGRQGQPDHDVAFRERLDLVPVLVEDAHVVAGHRP